MTPLTPTKIKQAPSTTLNTRLAEICLEATRAPNETALRNLHDEQSAVITELQMRKKQILEASFY